MSVFSDAWRHRGSWLPFTRPKSRPSGQIGSTPKSFMAVNSNYVPYINGALKVFLKDATWNYNAFADLYNIEREFDLLIASWIEPIDWTPVIYSGNADFLGGFNVIDTIYGRSSIYIFYGFAFTVRMQQTVAPFPYVGGNWLDFLAFSTNVFGAISASGFNCLDEVIGGSGIERLRLSDFAGSPSTVKELSFGSDDAFVLVIQTIGDILCSNV